MTAKAPGGNAGLCFTALGVLGEATGAEIRTWLLRNRDERRTARQVRHGIEWLLLSQLPLAEMTERIPAGRGCPGVYRLTGRGRAIFASMPS